MRTIRRPGLLLFASLAAALASAQTSVSEADRNAIQALAAKYSETLFSCDAEGYADLFVPETGYFASGFRGRMLGRQRLIELVESERHCIAPEAGGRAGGTNVPPVMLERTADGLRGLIDLGSAEYQDQYRMTSDGWRFASRTVLLAAEKAAGLDAAGLLAIQLLTRPEPGDYYTADVNDTPRLLVSGVAVSVDDGKVTGRAYLKDGSSIDEVYERSDSGDWRIVSSMAVAPEGP